MNQLEELHAWLMAEKHRQQVESVKWRDAECGGMQARAGGRVAALSDVLNKVRELMKGNQ